MRRIYVAIGINEHVTALIVNSIGNTCPHTFAPEKFLGDLNRRGFQSAGQWIGDTTLNLLLLSHPDVFAPFANLRTSDTRQVARYPSSGKVVNIAPVILDGVLRPHLAIGVAGCDTALTMRIIGGKERSYSPEMPLITLDSLGFSYAAEMLGQAALIALAFQFPTELAPYPDLIAPPKNAGI